MKELSMHILDIVQNSISAGASLVEIEIRQSLKEDKLCLSITDNGKGMPKDFLERVTDPFATTRTTRKVGLGVPLLKLTAEQCGGKFEIKSKEGEGTRVTADFTLSSIDRPPVGDMAGTVASLVSANEKVDFIYKLITDTGEFYFDTRDVKETLETDCLLNMEIINWINGYIEENIGEIGGERY